MLRLGDLGTYWRNTRSMPSLVRMFCQGSMLVPPIFVVLAAWPISDWSVNGKNLTYSEFWASGPAPTIASGLILVTIGAWGAAARNSRSRWAILFSVPVPYLVAFSFDYLTSYSSGYDWFDLIGSVIMTFLLYLVFFRLEPVVNWYAHGNQEIESA